MASRKDDSDEYLKEISDQLRLSRKTERRRRVENVHILVAIGIIGTYFTSPAQEFLTSNAIESTTGVFVFGAGCFLGLKVITLTIRMVWNPKPLEVLGELVAPFIFVIGVVGYLIWLFFQFVTISLNVNIEPNRSMLFIVALLSIVSSVVAYLNYSQYRNEIEEKEEISGRIYERKMFGMLSENPELIEPGLTIKEIQPNKNSYSGIIPDVLAEDADGNEAFIELKRRVDSNTVQNIYDQYREILDDNRVIIVSSSFVGRSKERLKDYGFEPREFGSLGIGGGTEK